MGSGVGAEVEDACAGLVFDMVGVSLAERIG